MTDMEALIARIQSKCEEVGDCLVWTGCLNQGKYPQIKVGPAARSVRHILWEHKNGPIPANRLLSQTCTTPGCVCHVEPQTRSKVNKRAGERGAFSTPQRGAKIAAHKRAAEGKITLEQAMDIRYGGGLLKDKAAQYGICPSNAAAIRRGERWKEYGANPFEGLMR